ncbi:MAG: thiamine pyrophosphate-dependent dehydrogenase E1 component subunit alpha [Chloroflexi bacterium AL-W]|nr:thiamine pyrophosphate-dependent dehydrogenase E1 component subunit alpha [Chloroflexi bacterium AL-N1]NOK68713.1 thiamine pyrophosphate-dependent dehydrogenase E1 component subunit alpha [Chloroflexi bacterium AL-N10]NOK76199.1 thiamine pyrophosphate-dependent dehydrogenase E1 component subunit alpha [Chloroflexi bacterium AL-N5]NOK84164.1 thiamine pyrophosphate-dependent dehydrogenase E1 component subunit alpha [Chloroflexi bacterium AL-W]NOK91337.1 thiamine pyrophosphate-dependent dehydro
MTTTANSQPLAVSAAQSIDTPTMLEMYHVMLLARALDERMWLLNRAGKTPFVISCQGHEAAQVGAVFALQRGKDFLLPYYRGLAAVLAMGMTSREVMLASLARANDPNSGGRQMPAHYSKRDLKIVTQSSVVGTQIPHAAGIGLAEKIKGGDAVAWTSFGEGTTSQGDFHEALNLAGVHKLPVIFQCENNDYAISVPMNQQMAIDSVADRASAYGIRGVKVDGTDVLSTYVATQQAVELARKGEGSTLLEAKCIRLTPHSSDDNDRTYRPADELKQMRQHDPIARFQTFLRSEGILNDANEKELTERITAEVNDATTFAEQSPLPDPDTLLDHVYAE